MEHDGGTWWSNMGVQNVGRTCLWNMVVEQYIGRMWWVSKFEIKFLFKFNKLFYLNVVLMNLQLYQANYTFQPTPLKIRVIPAELQIIG